MLTTIAGAEFDASDVSPESGSHEDVTPASESSPHEWLYRAAYGLLGKDAGWQLAQITGYPVTSCRAYVAHDPRGRRRQPDHFSRTLIHSEDGGDFHRAFMESCGAMWWQQFRDDAELGRQVRELIKD